jgi:putative transposase
MKECLRFNGIIKECVISCVNFTYYASFRIELDNLDNFFKIDNNLYCGVDLGIKDLAIINGSDGYYKKYSSLIISKLKYYNKKIDYYNRILSKKIPNSNNYEKTRIKLNHCYKRIKNIRNDYLNKITTNLCKRYKYICIEDLPINNLLKNRKLSRYIALSCWYTFKCMLSYKSDLYNNIIILAEREYPSSQLCSNCGNRQKLKLSQRIYKCPKCGLIIDRDFNASINLKNYGIDCINNYEIEYI